MEKLIDDLLYFSRLGRQESGISPNQLNEVVHDISSMMESSVRGTPGLNPLPNLCPMWFVDSTRIQEVFRNLITTPSRYNLQPESWSNRVASSSLDDKGSVAGNVFYVR